MHLASVVSVGRFVRWWRVAANARGSSAACTYFIDVFRSRAELDQTLPGQWRAARVLERKELACGQPVAKLQDMNEPGLISAAEMARRASSAGPSAETDDDDPPAGSVAHEDLLDTDWLQRADEDIGGDEDGVDVGMTLDLDTDDDADELAQILDLDVGPLLTSLLPSAFGNEAFGNEGVDMTFEAAGREPHDAGFGLGALREHLLPERTLDPARAGEAPEQNAAERGDDEVGDDERFPVFEEVSMVLPSTPSPPEDDD